MPRRELLVFDAAPLIALSSAGLLDEVFRLGVRAVIPEEVRDGVLTGGRGAGTASELVLDRMIRDGAFSVGRVKDRSMMARELENRRLSAPDAAAVCLARESGGRLVADDRDLRTVARALGVPLGGSLYILNLAVTRGRLSPKAAVDAVERMTSSGWYCSPALLRAFSEFLLESQ